MTSISNYELKFNEKENIYYVIALKPEKSTCPICRSELNPKGWPKRQTKLSGGEKITLKVRRYECRKCASFHRELPDMIVPYKRHCLETIEKIVAGAATDVCCEESTIRRIRVWWAAMQLYIKNALNSIKERFEINLSAVKKPGEIVRALVNTHLWPSTRSALMPREK